MSGGILYEVSFEGCHPVLVVERGVGAAPQVPIVVTGIFTVRIRGVVVESGAQHKSDLGHQPFAFAFFAFHIHLF